MSLPRGHNVQNQLNWYDDGYRAYKEGRHVNPWPVEQNPEAHRLWATGYKKASEMAN